MKNQILTLNMDIGDQKFIEIEKEIIDPNEYTIISKFIEWLNINSNESNIDDYFPGFEIN